MLKSNLIDKCKFLKFRLYLTKATKPLKGKNITFSYFVITVNCCMLDPIIETEGRALKGAS